ncbi:MAG: DUF4190 domain-containing protein [bacterium]
MTFNCPACSKPVEAEPDATGSVLCPGCGNSVAAPIPVRHPEAASGSIEQSAPEVAIISLVSALLSIPLCCLGIPLAIVAIVCGHIGWSKIKQSDGTMAGDGMCLAGLIIGYVSLTFWTCVTTLFVMLAIIASAAGPGA